MKVLIVEDDPIAAAVLEASLTALHYDVALTANGREAWQRFSEERFPIVLSDWMMPELNGLELCQRIRAQGGEYTYFIMLSNLAVSGGNVELAMEAGVDDFLHKPVNPTELHARLRVARRIMSYVAEVRQLQSIIPICGYCRKMRDDKNYWSQVEEYLGSQTGAVFSHGVCPECYEKVLVPEMRKAGIKPPPYPEVRRVQQ